MSALEIITYGAIALLVGMSCWPVFVGVRQSLRDFYFQKDIDRRYKEQLDQKKASAKGQS